MRRRDLAVAAWLGVMAILVALVPVSAWLNQPTAQEREVAKRALVEAGYPGAQLSGSERAASMARCGFAPIRNRGRAFAWRTKARSGVFCLPANGRLRILVDPSSEG